MGALLASLRLIAAEDILSISGLLLLLVAGWWGDRAARFITGACVLALAGAAVFTVPALSGGVMGHEASVFFGQYAEDSFAAYAKLLIYGAAVASLLVAPAFFERLGAMRAEYPLLVLFATLGMGMMVSATDMLTLYIGLELNSLAAYVLASFLRNDERSAEAGLKYFVLGALASGFMLYGMSMIYGATGSLDLSDIADAIGSGQISYLPLTFGLVFLVAGLAFKLGAVPFHMWVPDVYQGAPTAITLVLAAAPKLAAFAITLRLLVQGLGDLTADWQPMLMIMAILSLAIGNLTAIAQTNFKRMLAYSTISHMGFVLLGLMSGSLDGNQSADASAYGSALFYILTYVLTTLASFGVIMFLSRDGFECETIDDLKGLNRRSPFMALVLLFLMASLAGLPPFVGFYAKLLVLQSLLQSDHLWLAVVAVFFSLIGAFYYLRVIKVVYDPVGKNTGAIPVMGFAPRLVMTVNGALMLVLGLMPGWLMALCLVVMRASLT